MNTSASLCHFTFPIEGEREGTGGREEEGGEGEGVSLTEERRRREERGRREDECRGDGEHDEGEGDGEEGWEPALNVWEEIRDVRRVSSNSVQFLAERMGRWRV